ncbi:DUF3224 domain-containing protein [Streptacidiphilus cavernicola]|uniref:DUF3224 domain-containing protein n=1 Tax=Streptacidiphilus cavernicola TaxID=3342716 RepID=A0ABV6W1P1_9ACTN
MSKRVTSAFSIDKWEGKPADWHGAQLQRTEAAKTFTGDLAGTSALEAVMLGVGENVSAYVAVERMEVEFDGLKGSFCLLHAATANGDENEMKLTIIPGSGTGDLVGLTGTAVVLPGHEFALEYDL